MFCQRQAAVHPVPGSVVTVELLDSFGASASKAARSARSPAAQQACIDLLPWSSKRADLCRLRRDGSIVGGVMTLGSRREVQDRAEDDLVARFLIIRIDRLRRHFHSAR